MLSREMSNHRTEERSTESASPGFVQCWLPLPVGSDAPLAAGWPAAGLAFQAGAGGP